MAHFWWSWRERDKKTHKEKRERAWRRGRHAEGAEGYRAQLAQVEQKPGDPSHAPSLQLRAQLQELVELYTQLLGADGSGGEQEGSDAGAGSDGASARGAGLAGGGSRPDVSAWAFPVGAVCEFKSPDGQWYPVCVVAGSAASPTVRFFGFGQEKTVEVSDLRAVPPLDPGYLSPVTVQDGLDCEAKYYADGSWYAARVQKVVKDARVGDSAQVLFTKYGNVEEVPLSYLRVPGLKKGLSSSTSSSSSAGNQEKKRSSSSFASDSMPEKKKPKIMAIPEKLHAKEGDTDKERDAKRKRMRAIKSKNRFARMEIESMERQHSWQSFNKKKTKKLARMGYSSKSIFASTGKKVGHGATGRR